MGAPNHGAKLWVLTPQEVVVWVNRVHGLSDGLTSNMNQNPTHLAVATWTR